MKKTDRMPAITGRSESEGVFITAQAARMRMPRDPPRRGYVQRASWALVAFLFGQVLNTQGEIIPRLYCGSTAAQSPTGRGYGFGGATLTNGIVTGYVAAGHICTLQPCE